MTKKNISNGCNPSGETFGCTPGSGCQVEAVLSVDERGQMISWSRGGDVCCLALMKADNLSGMVKDVLGPLMQGQERK